MRWRPRYLDEPHECSSGPPSWRTSLRQRHPHGDVRWHQETQRSQGAGCHATAGASGAARLQANTSHINCPHQAQMRSRCALVRRPLTAAQRRHRPAPCMSRRSFPQALAPFCNRTIASNSTPPCPASERLSGLGAQSSGKPVAGPAPGARCQVEEYSMAGGRGGRWWALPATCPF